MFIDTISLEIATLSLFPALHISQRCQSNKGKNDPSPAVSKCQTVLTFNPVSDEMRKERQDSEPFMKLQGIQFEGVYSEIFALPTF